MTVINDRHRPDKEAPHKVYVGVDPGASGGLAAIINEVAEAVAMPNTEADVWHWFHGLRTDFPESVLIGSIEQVGGYAPGKDGTGHPGSRMFKFGWGYGGLRMAMYGNGVIVNDVRPQKWQRYLGMIRNKTESDVQWKNRLKSKAQMLFPDQRVTLSTADALLIAYYTHHTRVKQ